MLTTLHPVRRSASDTFHWQLHFSLRDWRAKGFLRACWHRENPTYKRLTNRETAQTLPVRVNKCPGDCRFYNRASQSELFGWLLLA